MGATTIWERWDSIRPDGSINPSGMTSLNHYALGAVVDWMHRTIGGLTAVEPGYSRMRVAPQPGRDITSAVLRHTTGHGEVVVDWRIADGEARVLVTIPAGTSAEVALPLHPDANTIEISAGTHEWSYPVKASNQGGAYSLDSTLSEVAADPNAWRLFTDAFGRHVPGVPLDGNAPEAAALSIRTLLDYIPGASEELKTDLEASLDAATTGASA
jgi:alpha-L-rhamnosidase